MVSPISNILEYLFQLANWGKISEANWWKIWWIRYCLPVPTAYFYCFHEFANLLLTKNLIYNLGWPLSKILKASHLTIWFSNSIFVFLQFRRFVNSWNHKNLHCFRHSGVMWAPKCSANFMPLPPVRLE